MTPNLEKIDNAVLALLHLTSFAEGNKDSQIVRAWKGHDWQTLNRLHEKGMIGDPKNKAKSVALTDEGQRRSAELFEKLFCS